MRGYPDTPVTYGTDHVLTALFKADSTTLFFNFTSLSRLCVLYQTKQKYPDKNVIIQKLVEHNYGRITSSTVCANMQTALSFYQCLYQGISTFSAMSALHCSPRNRKPKRDMKNGKTRKRGLRPFTMTGSAAKPTEETLNQMQRVEDMVTVLT